MFTPVIKQYQDENNLITVEKQKEKQAQVRIDSYMKEIEHLNAMVDQGLSNSAEDRQLKLQLDGALKDRVDLILPATTGFDQAYEFLLQA